MFVDSHCHILSEEFENDREDCFNRALAAGVSIILEASGGVETEKLALAERFCQAHPNVYAGIGVHPEYAENFADVRAEQLIALSKARHIVGIGECGLDFYYNSDTEDIQIKVFIEHIKAAQKTKLPLIIHAREADEKMMEILGRMYEREKFTGVLHCFSSSRRLAEFALDIGLYVSASGIITFNKSEDLRRIFADIPLERLLIETDAPYLAPVPFRGKRNEPAFVGKTAEKLAEIKGLDVEKLAEITTVNFRRLFAKTTD